MLFRSADANLVRPEQERAEICAGFDLSNIPEALAWLEARDLAASEGSDCILRRVITAQGRSRAYINGQSSTLQDCTELGEMLIDIYSQHAHQSLLRRANQRLLLDAYAGIQADTEMLAELASAWHALNRDITELESARDEHDARVQLLSYQVSELDSLDVQLDEVENLEVDQKKLANAETNLQSAQQALSLIADDDGSLDQIGRAHV